MSRYDRWTILACSLGSSGLGEVQQEGSCTCPSLDLWDLEIILEAYVISSLLMMPLFSLPSQTKERCQK